MGNANLNQQEIIKNTHRLSSLTKDLEAAYYMGQEKETTTMGKLRDLLLQMNGFMKAIVALSKDTSLEKKALEVEKKFMQLSKGVDGEHTHIQVNRKRFKDFKNEIDAFLHTIEN